MIGKAPPFWSWQPGDRVEYQGSIPEWRGLQGVVVGPCPTETRGRFHVQLDGPKGVGLFEMFKVRSESLRPVEDPDPLLDHPAVANYGYGVESEDFASFVECLASRAASRVRGVGAEQYGQGSLQKFETMSNLQTVEELLDELADVIAYTAMIGIRAAALVYDGE